MALLDDILGGATQGAQSAIGAGGQFSQFLQNVPNIALQQVQGANSALGDLTEKAGVGINTAVNKILGTGTEASPVKPTQVRTVPAGGSIAGDINKIRQSREQQIPLRTLGAPRTVKPKNRAEYIDAVASKFGPNPDYTFGTASKWGFLDAASPFWVKDVDFFDKDFLYGIPKDTDFTPEFPPRLINSRQISILKELGEYNEKRVKEVANFEIRRRNRVKKELADATGEPDEWVKKRNIAQRYVEYYPQLVPYLIDNGSGIWMQYIADDYKFEPDPPWLPPWIGSKKLPVSK